MIREWKRYRWTSPREAKPYADILIESGGEKYYVSDEVLICFEEGPFGKIAIGRFELHRGSIGVWRCSSTEKLGNVVYWMDIPDIPTQQGEKWTNKSTQKESTCH